MENNVETTTTKKFNPLSQNNVAEKNNNPKTSQNNRAEADKADQTFTPKCRV